MHDNVQMGSHTVDARLNAYRNIVSATESDTILHAPLPPAYTHTHTQGVKYAYRSPAHDGHDGLAVVVDGWVPAPRARDGGNKDDPVHHWTASVALWRPHCQAGIDDMSPIPYDQISLFPVAVHDHMRTLRQHRSYGARAAETTAGRASMGENAQAAYAIAQS